MEGEHGPSYLRYYVDSYFLSSKSKVRNPLSFLNLLKVFCKMSSESQVRSLLDVVTFILERLSPSETFDENIFSDYFRKHHDIVEARHHAPYEAIIIPESDAFQDDINNHVEKDLAEPNKSGKEDENIMTTKAIVIAEIDAFGDDDLEEDSDNDDDDLSIKDFDKGNTSSVRKEPIEVKVVSATIVNKKEDCESVEFENEYFEEDLDFFEEGFEEKPSSLENELNLEKPIENQNKSSKIMMNKVVGMESREQKVQSEEEVWEMHGDFDNTPKDFPHETLESLVSSVSEELKDGKVNCQEALSKIRTGKKLSRKKKSKMEFTCSMCPENFMQKNLLKIHLEEQHSRVFCQNETCDFTADTLIEIMDHQKVHKMERFKCHICGKEGLMSKQLLIHLKKKHLPNLSNDECPLCSFKGSWIERHIQTMHSQMECVCHICDKTLMGPGKLKLHIYRQHTLGRNFPCKTCNKVCSTRQSLERHEGIHTVKEKSIPCDECDKKFLTILLLNEHKNNCHKPKKLLCSQCDFKTYKQSILKQHSVVHSEDRPFQCHTCAHSFKTKEVLRKHEFYHTGIRKEECLVCGKKFKNAASLKIHKKQHEGHYDAYCQPCDKKFVQEYNYKVHVEKHHAREYLP